jgi:hypothetical protein
MTHFKAKQTRPLTELGRDLVDAYNKTPGSSGPYANPESLQAVTDLLMGHIDGKEQYDFAIFNDD